MHFLRLDSLILNKFLELANLKTYLGIAIFFFYFNLFLSFKSITLFLNNMDFFYLLSLFNKLLTNMEAQQHLESIIKSYVFQRYILFSHTTSANNQFQSTFSKYNFTNFIMTSKHFFGNKTKDAIQYELKNTLFVHFFPNQYHSSLFFHSFESKSYK